MILSAGRQAQHDKLPLLPIESVSPRRPGEAALGNSWPSLTMPTLILLFNPVGNRVHTYHSCWANIEVFARPVDDAKRLTSRRNYREPVFKPSIRLLSSIIRRQPASATQTPTSTVVFLSSELQCSKHKPTQHQNSVKSVPMFL